MKFILVTGAYGGMGQKVSELLSRQGYTVFALDMHIGAAGDNIYPIQADITDGDSLEAAYKKVTSITDELHGIIHLAGIYMLDSLIEIERERFKTAFNVNFIGAYLVNKTFFPLLNTGSRIIITTSEMAPLAPLPFTGVYTVTKSTLDKYAYSLRMELQLLYIHVSVLRAGAVKTGMLGASTSELDKFCENTKLYSYNASRFKGIVNSVEARSVSPQQIAEKIYRILNKKNPRFSYSINRNPFLLLLNALPKRLQFFIIRQILK